MMGWILIVPGLFICDTVSFGVAHHLTGVMIMRQVRNYIKYSNDGNYSVVD